ncbi:HPr family phosphocarrier protein [Chrysiogenes arsenatis]|uniref:HPr family phosphocarrier protein n=1 Tax=Chrysiogenes arsenatis TaxID=309797 RepID=UPI00040EBDB2|nr:HPr family phosphocarrier protein [Chrysiogenes arsenatis]
MATHLNTCKKVIKIQNRLGLHARAAAKLVKVATAWDAKLTLSHMGRNVNAKSILGLLMLAAPMGSEVEIVAEGVDAQEALEAVETLFNQRFDEE